MTNEGSEEFARRLKITWLSGRAEQIADEMLGIFSKYLAEQAPRRAQELIVALDAAPLVPGMSAKDQGTWQAMMAWTQAVVEGALVAVALQLAREEAKEPPAQSS